MSYIKISDPNIIDLAAWHQVINVINQHSDSITAITNNFGAQGTGVTSWDGDADIFHQYDPGSQKILYGRTRVDVVDTPGYTAAAHTTDKDIFYGDIVFKDDASGTTSFNGRPIVTATVQFGNETISRTDAGIVCTTYNQQATGFSYRVRDAKSDVGSVIELAGHFYINWMAIGPK